MDITLIISGGVLLGCMIGLSWFAGSDAPFVPTKMDQIRKVLKIAGAKRGKKFYELGSGDGRVVFEAAKLGAESYGIEESWIRVLYSRYKTSLLLHNKAWRLASHPPSLKLRRAGFRCGNVIFYHGNIFAKNYTDADIVYIYLLPKGVNKLENKLKKELKKGSQIITQTYHFKTWKPFQKIGNFWVYRA